MEENEKNKNLLKDELNIERKIDSENIEVSSKRKSFREKAKKFNSSDAKITKTTKKSKQKVGILTKKKDDEKRQGGWSQ